LERRLQEYLGSRVKIFPKTPEKGKIVIEYKNIEELESIIEKLLV